MVAGYIKYIIDTDKLEEFEYYAALWIPLVKKLGGQHYGYFFPLKGASNVALALFTFSSLSECEQYRNRSLQDAECLAAF